MDFLLENASLFEGAALLLAFAAVTAWERWRPLRHFEGARGERSLGNIGLLLINQALPYILVPASAALGAWAAGRAGFGLLQSIDLPIALAALLSLVLLDATAWAVHRAMHSSAWLWRIHKVHHSDLEFDGTLAFRFHPLETVLQSLAHTAVVVVLGLPVEAVLIAALVSIVHNLFVHANAALPPGAERVARVLLVTPDLHRIHHSADFAESMSNFGIVLPWWDRLAGTYRRPTGREAAAFGLADERASKRLTLGRLLLMPLERTKP